MISLLVKMNFVVFASDQSEQKARILRQYAETCSMIDIVSGISRTRGQTLL
jgi:hypothetical protein